MTPRSALAALALLAAACGAGPVTSAGSTAGGVLTPGLAPSPSGSVVSPSAVYVCHDHKVPLGVLTQGRPATELGPDGLAALGGEEVRRPPDLERWRVVEEGPERVALMADREVRLLIGVAGAPGRAQTCQGNPRTPFTVELSAPLGDRVLLDAAIHPVRRIR
ncbi:hypothetical protein ACIBHY_52160 [Nonomuraea sp. NPDC050547]|uniref:hypothetical protein n=1 Tax=Nonomuraea sp. NPDC050547 TaxID=3364368 RepID=UPI00379F7BD3